VEAEASAKRATGWRKVEGRVTDTRGRPVAGATVVCASVLGADSVGLGFPAGDFDDTLRLATSDHDGHFVIPDAAPAGAIAAQLGDLRSKPEAITQGVRLVLEPTRSISGKVDIGGVPAGRVRISAVPADRPFERFHLLAPVLPDGSFTLSGVSVGPLRVGVSFSSRPGLGEDIEFTAVPASSRSITDLHLTATVSSRALDIIVRSAVATPLEGAQVLVLSGKTPVGKLRTVADLSRWSPGGLQVYLAKPVDTGNVAPAVLEKLRPRDLVAHVDHARAGDLTVCAIAFGIDFADPNARRRMQERLSELAMKCEWAGPDASVVVVAAPPQQPLE
jgi:hypothetical protein